YVAAHKLGAVVIPLGPVNADPRLEFLRSACRSPLTAAQLGLEHLTFAIYFCCPPSASLPGPGASGQAMTRPETCRPGLRPRDAGHPGVLPLVCRLGCHSGPVLPLSDIGGRSERARVIVATSLLVAVAVQLVLALLTMIVANPFLASFQQKPPMAQRLTEGSSWA